MNEIIFKHFDGDCSDALEKFIETLGENTVVNLEPKDYFITRKVFVKDKKNFVLNGNGATIISEFNPASHEDYTGLFDFYGCDGVTLKNLNFNTSKPSSTAGKIVAVNPEENWFDVELYKGSEFTGTERIIGMNSMDSHGTPDLLVFSTHARGITYEVKNQNKIRIFHADKKLSLIKEGEQIAFRHSYGGYIRLKFAGVSFRNTKNILIEDINVYACVYYMFVVFPRCENMTIRNVCVKAKEGSNYLMGTNVDAVHILGLTGKLLIENSEFTGLGDDALNIHSTAGFIDKKDDGKISIINKRFSTPMDEDWCRKGDVIAVYSTDFKKKGTITVDDYNNSEIYFKDYIGEFDEGDVVANTAYYAATTVRNCVVKNSRVRAFLLQTENVIIENCKFYGMAAPALIMAPDIDEWYEVGPVKNAMIRNNVFEKCAIASEKYNYCAIISNTCHKTLKYSPYMVHENITISNNTFINSGLCNMNSTDGLKIINNKVVNNDCKAEKPIIYENCKNVKISGD